MNFNNKPDPISDEHIVINMSLKDFIRNVVESAVNRASDEIEQKVNRTLENKLSEFNKSTEEKIKTHALGCPILQKKEIWDEDHKTLNSVSKKVYAITVIIPVVITAILHFIFKLIK